MYTTEKEKKMLIQKLITPRLLNGLHSISGLTKNKTLIEI